MSNRGIKIKTKFDGEEKEHYQIKKGKDNSHYIIPKNTENKDGEHVSVHPSGFVNIRSKTKNSYDILRKIPDIQEYIKKRLSEPVKITNADFALILDYGNLKNFAEVRSKEHVLDMDSYFENCEEIEIKNDNFDFLDFYQGDLITIVVFNQDGKAFFAFKNKRGFGIPMELKD